MLPRHLRCKSFGLILSREHTPWYVRCDLEKAHLGTDNHLRYWGSYGVHWTDEANIGIQADYIDDNFLDNAMENEDCIRAVDRLVCKFGEDGDCKCPDSSKVGVNKIGRRV